jgi:cytochrome c553
MKHLACVIGLVAGLATVSAFAQTGEASLPAGPAKDLTIAKCSTCHGFGRVAMYQRTRAQWAATVDLMKDKGLEASDAEIKEIVDYLATALPPAPEQDAAPAPNQTP